MIIIIVCHSKTLNLSMIVYKVSVYSVIIIYVNTTSSIKSVEISYNAVIPLSNGSN